MSLQSIINICESIQVDRRKVVSVQYTRSEIARVDQTPTRNPWKFNLIISARLPYETNRGLIEEIDRLDRTTAETVTFSNFSWLFAYQGAMTSNQISAVRVSSFSGTTLTLGTLPSIGAGEYLFKKGDLIQIADFPYPFTVTADVQRGSQSTVAVSVHRGNFIAATVANKGINVGSDCQFKVFCPNMPTWRLIPGGKTALIEWTSDFTLVEYTGDTL